MDAAHRTRWAFDEVELAQAFQAAFGGELIDMTASKATRRSPR